MWIWIVGAGAVGLIVGFVVGWGGQVLLTLWLLKGWPKAGPVYRKP